MDDSIQTAGAMGIPRNSYPVAAAISWQHLKIAVALLEAGANPAAGDYAAYREARALRDKPNLASETVARLDKLISQLAPKGKDLERIQAELRLQVVEQKLNQVALESLRAIRGSSEADRLEQEYQSLQKERTRLQEALK
jgi:hypothetical protein